MAYTEGMLRRYAASITDPDSKDRFTTAIDSIEFEDVDGVRTCVGLALDQALNGTSVFALIEDLNARLLEFWDEVDFANQREGAIKWEKPVKIFGVNRWSLPRLTVDLFSDVEEGGVIAEGQVMFTLAGGLPGVPWDTEYMVTDDGTIYADNFLFRGCGGRVRLIKQADGIHVEPV